MALVIGEWLYTVMTLQLDRRMHIEYISAAKKGKQTESSYKGSIIRSTIVSCGMHASDLIFVRLLIT